MKLVKLWYGPVLCGVAVLALNQAGGWQARGHAVTGAVLLVLGSAAMLGALFERYQSGRQTEANLREIDRGRGVLVNVEVHPHEIPRAQREEATIALASLTGLPGKRVECGLRLEGYQFIVSAEAAVENGRAVGELRYFVPRTLRDGRIEFCECQTLPPVRDPKSAPNVEIKKGAAKT